MHALSETQLRMIVNIRYFKPWGSPSQEVGFKRTVVMRQWRVEMYSFQRKWYPFTYTYTEKVEIEPETLYLFSLASLFEIYWKDLLIPKWQFSLLFFKIYLHPEKGYPFRAHPPHTVHDTVYPPPPPPKAVAGLLSEQSVNQRREASVNVEYTQSN